MLDCLRFEELISAALDGELTEADERALSAHLDVCADCRDLLALYREMDALSAENRLEPPEALLDGVLSRLSVPAPVKRRTLPLFVRYGALAACVALVIWVAPLLKSAGDKGAVTAESAAGLTGAADGETCEYFMAMALPENDGLYDGGLSDGDLYSGDRGGAAAPGGAPDAAVPPSHAAPESGTGQDGEASEMQDALPFEEPSDGGAWSAGMQFGRPSVDIGADAMAGSVEADEYAGVIHVDGDLPEVLADYPQVPGDDGESFVIPIPPEAAEALMADGYEMIANSEPLLDEYVVIYTPAG